MMKNWYEEIFERVDLIAIGGCIILGILLVAAYCSYRVTGESDNIYEEHAEQLIEHSTGLILDLSPYSPE